jgi:hypothetical protein
MSAHSGNVEATPPLTTKKTVGLDDSHAKVNALHDIDTPQSPIPSIRRPKMELTRDSTHRIHALARVYSNMSTASNARASDINPFHDSHDTSLDPSSPDFNAENWARAYLVAVARDPDRFPQRTAGISYRELDVFGFGSRTDYQKDVLNIWFRVVDIVTRMFRKKERIPILTDFDGLVKSGEMCLVPGTTWQWSVDTAEDNSG